MNIVEVNSIFSTKYPTGCVTQKGKLGNSSYKVAVTFDSKGRVYEYSCRSYAELLTRLNFQVTYEKDVESIKQKINSLEQELTAGGYEDLFSDDFIPYTEEEVNSLQSELKHQKERLTYIIV